MEKEVASKTVILKPNSMPCFNWTYQGKSEKRTVIIAPIRLKTLPDGSLEVAWACSVGNTCEDVCRYAKGKEKVVEELG